MKRKVWTKREIEILINRYPNERSDVIAKDLGCKVSSVYYKANSLKLKKSIEFKRSPDSGILTKGATIGKSTQFPKGHIPHNKGKKMSPELRDKIKHTWFTKGHKPHNTKTNGYLSVRTDTKSGIPYIYIRISEGNWELYHRYLWKQAYGEIPPGKLITFKDGNQANCSLKNLEMIDMVENMQRNTIHRYPEDIKKTIKILSSLTKKINKYERKK